jgi:hydroxyacylglutathione hydrolase
VPNLDELVKEGTPLTWSGREVDIIETPGHTLGHVCYHFKEDNIIFTGDTLFALGCGRLFEGTPAQMWNSLSKLMNLPKKTKVYCGHEYTLSNAEFACKYEPNNIDLQTRILEIRAARSKNQPTIPTTIEKELLTNPFLRASSPELRENLNLANATDEEVFTEIRNRKNNE